MFLLSGIRFGSVRFDLFRFGPPRRNGTPPRQPFAGRTQRIRRRAAFVFRSAATTSARHRTFAPPPVGPPRRVRPPCRRHGLHSARCRRPFIRPLRRGIRPPHGSGPLRSSPVARSALCPSPAFRVLCFPSPLRTSAAVLRIVRLPTTLTASAARRSRQDARSVFPLFRGRPGSTAELNRPGLFGPALRSGRSGRCLTPAFRPESAPPRSSAPGSGFRFPVSGPTPPRCPAP